MRYGSLGGPQTLLEISGTESSKSRSIPRELISGSYKVPQEW